MAMDKLNLQPQVALDLENMLVGDFNMAKQNFLAQPELLHSERPQRSGNGRYGKSARELKHHGGCGGGGHRGGRHHGLFNAFHHMSKCEMRAIIVASLQVSLYVLYAVAFAYVKS